MWGTSISPTASNLSITWLGVRKLIVPVFHDFAGEMPHEIENARVGPLVLAEGFVIHEQVADEPVAVDLADPAGEFFGGQRPLFPGAVGKPEGDVVAEPVIFEQQLELGRMRRAINEIWAAISQNLVHPLGEDGVVSHVAHEMGQIVVVDQLGIAKNPRLLAEQVLDVLPVLFDLGPEFLARIKERQGVVICFVEKFHASGLVQVVEGFHCFRDILLDLLQGRAGDRIGDAEPPLMNADRFQQRPIGRDIAFVGDLPADFGVFVIVEIVPVGVENAVTPKPKRLMNLKIKAD